MAISIKFCYPDTFAFEVMLDAIDPEILNFQLFLLIPCFSPGFKNFGLAKNDDILDAL